MLTKQDLYFHEKCNKPQPDGKQCFKANSYYEEIKWLTIAEKIWWAEIDDQLKQTKERPEGWENYKVD